EGGAAEPRCPRWLPPAAGRRAGDVDRRSRPDDGEGQGPDGNARGGSSTGCWSPRSPAIPGRLSGGEGTRHDRGGDRIDRGTRWLTTLYPPRLRPSGISGTNQA